jgi:integrase
MSRAPNGSSTISLGKDGRWHTWVTVGHKKDGSLDRRHIHRKTATAVKDAVKELRERVERNSGVATKAETVEQWLTFWMTHVVEPRLTYGTNDDYGKIVRNHLIPNLGQWRINGTRKRLEPEYVEAMYAKMRSAGVGSSYILKTHSILRKALKDALRRNRASRNVCDLIDRPTSRRVKISAHTLAEVEAILTTAMQDPMAARWLLAMLLGLRQGEVLGLHWGRVHLDASEPYIEVDTQIQRHKWQHGCDDPVACVRTTRNAKGGPLCRTEPCPPRFEHGCGAAACGKQLAHFCPQRVKVAGCSRHQRPCPAICPANCSGHASMCPERVGGGLVEVDVKSEKGEREIPLPVVVVELLRQQRERQQVWLAEHGRKWDRAGLVFLNAQGRAIDPRRDHEAWEKLLERAGVDDSRLHAARHSAATYLLATGTDSRVVQEILGHSQLSVTEAYLDVARDLKRQAVDRIASSLLDGQLASLLQGPAPTRKR